MISELFAGIFDFFFYIIVERAFFDTGEAIIYIFTFGAKKPRWGRWDNDQSAKSALFTELSTWMGFFFWLFIIGWALRIIFFDIGSRSAIL